MSENKELNSSKQKDSAKVYNYSTFEEFNENTHRVRRNLLIFSVIVLFYKLSGATLTKESFFFGLQFENLSPAWIDLFLLCIVIYHFIHFAWLVFEHLVNHRIKYFTMFEIENEEDKENIKKRIMKRRIEDINGWSLAKSLKNRKIEINKNIEGLRLKLEGIEKIKEELKIIEAEMEINKNIEGLSIEGLRLKIKNSEGIEKIKEEFKIIKAEMENLNEEFWKNYDSIKEYSAMTFIKINNGRFLFIETFIPLLMGLSAVGFLSSNIFLMLKLFTL